MTYIAAFRCQHGLVMCADTQETRGDQKNYTEKLEIDEDHSFPIAVGGAGVDDIIRPLMQEILERVVKGKPATKAALRTAIKASIKEVYEKDVPLLVVKRQHLTPQLLIAAKPTNEEFCIFPVIGRRLYKEQRRAIVGYPSNYNFGLLERFHRDDLPIQQAVILATYLVSQSKKYDDGVSGDTSIAVVTNRGAFQERPTYVSYLEEVAKEFLKLTDGLLLACLDTSLGEKRLRKRIAAFTEDVIAPYRKHIDSTLQRLTIKEVFEYHPYQKSPVETLISFGSGGFKAQHDQAENERTRREFKQMREATESMAERFKQSKSGKSKDQQ